MAIKLGELFYNIDANTKGLETSAKKVNKINKGMSSGFKKLGAVIAAALTFEAARRLVILSDKFIIIETRLKNVTKSTEEFNVVFQKLFNIAQKNGDEFQSLAESFVKLNLSLSDTVKESTDLVKVTEILSRGFAASGTSAQTSSGVMLQLTQGLATNFKAAGQELNSIIEGAPLLAKTIAQQLGGNAATDLKVFAEQGKLTAKAFLDAVISSEKAIKSFEVPKTVGRSFQKLQNSLLVAVGTFSKIIGSNTSLASGIESLSSLIDDNFNKALINSLVFFKEIELETKSIRTIASDIASIFSAMAKSDAAKGLHSLWTSFYEKIALSTKAMGQALGNITGLISEQVNESKPLLDNQIKLNKLKEIELKIEQQKRDLIKAQSDSPLDMITTQGGLSADQIKENIRLLEEQKNAFTSNNSEIIEEEKERVEEAAKSNDQILNDYRSHLEEMLNATDKFQEDEKNITKKAKDISGLAGDTANQILDPEAQKVINSLKTEQELLQESYEEKKRIINENESILEETRGMWLKRNEEQYLEANEKIRDQESLQQQQLTASRQIALVGALSAIGDLNNQILDEMKSAGKEQTAAYKALFFANKAIQVIQMTANAFVAGSNMTAAIPGPVGVAAGIAVTAAGLAQAALVAGLTIADAGGGRLAGGQVHRGKMHQVSENGDPELLIQGGKQFLLPGSKGGNVIPSNKMRSNSGNSAPKVTIMNNGAPLQVESQSFTKDEVILIVRNSEDNAVNRVNSSLSRGAGSTNNALNSRNRMTRRGL